MSIQSVKDLRFWHLAHEVGVTSPDGEESPGAVFLKGVRDSVIEQVEYLIEQGEDVEGAVQAIQYNGADGEIADAAVPVYTYLKWQTFLDIAAWEVDLAEITDVSEPMDLDKQSNLALYLVASNLVSILLQEIEAE
ncbi:OCR-like antirestriction protein [Streptomyces phage Verse]|uniref:OCR-like antirestriction protein n=1 Tax=Streptomyces phage Verse TaxID=1673878 RepID=A0A0K1Y9V2_9CAUD|nr:OCR-like antirestriction protein [Streptomyces phage Verse]